MATDQEKTLEALNTALQIEADGKEFYTRASQQSSNELGKSLLAALAVEEDYHRQVFTRIYESIKNKNGWPSIDFHSDGGSGLRTVFARNITPQVHSSKDELEAVSTARTMETRTFDFYQSQLRMAKDPSEKDLYERLSAQEQEHNLVLADYYEYLQNPAGWFVKKEHPTLD